MSEQLEQVRLKAFALAFSGKFRSVEELEAVLGGDHPESWHLLRNDPDFRSYIGQIAHNSAKQNRD